MTIFGTVLRKISPFSAVIASMAPLRSASPQIQIPGDPSCSSKGAPGQPSTLPPVLQQQPGRPTCDESSTTEKESSAKLTAASSSLQTMATRAATATSENLKPTITHVNSMEWEDVTFSANSSPREVQHQAGYCTQDQCCKDRSYLWLPKRSHLFRNREECFLMMFSLIKLVKRAQDYTLSLTPSLDVTTTAPCNSLAANSPMTALGLTVATYLHQWYGWPLHLGFLATPPRNVTTIPPHWMDTIVVIDARCGSPAANYVVDFDFKNKFIVARPTEQYSQYVSQLPEIFMGTILELTELLQEITAAMQSCFEHIVAAPWRKVEFILSLYRASALVDLRSSTVLLRVLSEATQNVEETLTSSPLLDQLSMTELRSISTQWETLSSTVHVRHVVESLIPECLKGDGARVPPGISMVASPDERQTNRSPQVLDNSVLLHQVPNSVLQGMVNAAETEEFEKVNVEPSPPGEETPVVSALSQQLRYTSICDYLFSRTRKPQAPTASPTTALVSSAGNPTLKSSFSSSRTKWKSTTNTTTSCNYYSRSSASDMASSSGGVDNDHSPSSSGGTSATAVTAESSRESTRTRPRPAAKATSTSAASFSAQETEPSSHSSDMGATGSKSFMASAYQKLGLSYFLPFVVKLS